jgi:hypothetical protein
MLSSSSYSGLWLLGWWLFLIFPVDILIVYVGVGVGHAIIISKNNRFLWILFLKNFLFLAVIFFKFSFLLFLILFFFRAAVEANCLPKIIKGLFILFV